MLTWLNSNRSLHARESFLVCSAHKRPILLKSIEIIPGISDHDGIIIADLYLSAQINKRYPHNIPLWSQVNWEAIQASARDFSDTFLDDIAHYYVGQSLEKLESHIKNLMKEHPPTKTFTGHFHLPWLSPLLKRMVKKKGYMYISFPVTSWIWT